MFFNYISEVKLGTIDMADMNGNNKNGVDSKDTKDNNNGDNQNNYPEKVEKDKEDVVTVEEEKVVKDDDGDDSDDKGKVAIDKNNNNVVAGNDQVPDGAVGLPDEDVEMADVGCGRVLANQVARAVETVSDDPRAWFRMWLPDGKPGIVALGLNITVREVNARLAATFGQGVYFLGYRLVTGLTISAGLNLTLSQLDQMGLDLGIGTMAEDWFGEARED